MRCVIAVGYQNLGTVYATYKFWWAEDAAAGVRGWYFEADQDGEYPQNDRVIKAGEGSPAIGFHDGSNFVDSGAKWGEWQSVPEPTSGLLLLLGVAGLALRRRRA